MKTREVSSHKKRCGGASERRNTKMADKDKQAYWEGYNDYAKCGGHADDPITELFHPSYNPPSGREEAYKGGWERAKSESSKK
jgi:hypothetical protein